LGLRAHVGLMLNLFSMWSFYASVISAPDDKSVTESRNLIKLCDVMCYRRVIFLHFTLLHDNKQRVKTIKTADFSQTHFWIKFMLYITPVFKCSQNPLKLCWSLSATSCFLDGFRLWMKIVKCLRHYTSKLSGF